MKELGTPQMSEEQFVPQNMTELELYEIMGGFKMSFEVGIEKLAEFGFQGSDWTKIEKQLKDDCLNFGFCVVKTSLTHFLSCCDPEGYLLSSNEATPLKIHANSLAVGSSGTVPRKCEWFSNAGRMDFDLS